MYVNSTHTAIVQRAEETMAGLMFQWELSSTRTLYSKGMRDSW